MSVQHSLEKMKAIQSSFLCFLEEEDNAKEHYQKLLDIFSDPENQDNKQFLVELFHLITKIGNNHIRTPSFFEKIEKIIIHFKDQIKNTFLNTEIFSIFKSNKRILLFLIQEKMISVNQHIVQIITSRKYVYQKYPQYFAPEIKDIVKNNLPITKDDKEEEDLMPQNKDWIDEIQKELPEDFDEKRKVGGNDSRICELIRKDSIEEFIVYITRNFCSVNSTIAQSIFDTNPLLIKESKKDDEEKYLCFYRKKEEKKVHEIHLIEYAAFFGSIQIFQYLLLNGANLPNSLWFYTIHSNNAEIIHLLEENKVEPINNNFRECFIESIKCHHNDLLTMKLIQRKLSFNASNTIILNLFKIHS